MLMQQQLWLALMVLLTCMPTIHSFNKKPFRVSFVRLPSYLCKPSRLLAETASTLISTPSAAELTNTTNPVSFLPTGTKFCLCVICKTAYELDPSQWNDKKNLLVKCGICGKEWMQSTDRLRVSSSVSLLAPLSEDKIEQMQKILAKDSNAQKSIRFEKAGLFFGNLPYSYDEEALGKLLMEYGVTSIAVVKDVVGDSKGFAFVEFGLSHDAERALSEMNGFYVEPGRKLAVSRIENRPRKNVQPR